MPSFARCVQCVYSYISSTFWNSDTTCVSYKRVGRPYETFPVHVVVHTHAVYALFLFVQRGPQGSIRGKTRIFSSLKKWQWGLFSNAGSVALVKRTRAWSFAATHATQTPAHGRGARLILYGCLLHTCCCPCAEMNELRWYRSQGDRLWSFTEEVILTTLFIDVNQLPSLTTPCVP